MIMLTGVAVLGLLAGSLASFFRLDNGKSATESPTDGERTDSPASSGEDALRVLAAEVSALRRQVETLTARVTGASSTLAPQEPTTGQDTSGEPTP
jgi:voltage-gated potassium channel